MKLRISHDTEAPAALVLKAKGYTVVHYYVIDEDDTLPGQWDAAKDGRVFSATGTEELLGLVVMWEVRGDDWAPSDAERTWVEGLIETALIYDADGNIATD